MSEGLPDIQAVVGVWYASRVTQMPGYRLLGLTGIWVNSAPAVPPDPGGSVQDTRRFMVNVGTMMGTR